MPFLCGMVMTSGVYKRMSTSFKTPVKRIGVHLVLLTMLSLMVVRISVAEDIDVPPPVMEVLKARCAICHIQLRQRPSLLLNSKRWLARSGERFVMEQRILTPPPHGMPPGNPLVNEERTILQQYFAATRATH